jgi:di/tricarboxylate transporter
LLAVAVVLGILGVLPLSIALLAVIVCLALAGITPIQEAYRMVDWRLVVMVACMIGFGLAMYQSGAADTLAAAIIGLVAPFGLMPSLFALAFLTVALTQPMSNAAAALTMLPVAVSSAELLQVDPRPVAILVTLAASLSFIAPLEPALLIVYGPGRYRFVDFLRVGGPLTVFLICILVVLVPWFWPLNPNT